MYGVLTISLYFLFRWCTGRELNCTVQYSIILHCTVLIISCSDGVEEANYIRVIRKELMPWSNGLETEEQEIPDHVLVVMMQPIQTGHHVSHLQLLLCILQEVYVCLCVSVCFMCGCCVIAAP